MAALILLGVVLVSSQVMADTCPVKPVQQNFDVSKFMGKWYFVREATTMWHSSADYKCNQLDFTLQDNGDIQSDFTLYNKTSSQYQTFTRTIRKESPESTDGRFRIFREGFTGAGTMYAVLATDYDNYATVFMCRENSDTGAIKRMPYVISRTTSLSPERREEANRKLPTDFTFVESNHDDCPARN